jgi:hypothetical protein
MAVVVRSMAVSVSLIIWGAKTTRARGHAGGGLAPLFEIMMYPEERLQYERL